MKHYLTMLMPIAALSVAACNREPTTKAAPETHTDNPSTRAVTTVVGGHGTGTVKSIDQAAGKITLDHGAIPEAGWPAMTMTFDADPALLKNLSPGDRVGFAMITTGTGAKVTSIEPQPK